MSFTPFFKEYATLLNVITINRKFETEVIDKFKF